MAWYNVVCVAGWVFVIGYEFRDWRARKEDRADFDRRMEAMRNNPPEPPASGGRE